MHVSEQVSVLNGWEETAELEQTACPECKDVCPTERAPRYEARTIAYIQTSARSIFHVSSPAAHDIVTGSKNEHAVRVVYDFCRTDCIQQSECIMIIW
jgi:hypothetical protein